ncbi:hypothetical protein R5R35_009131 [Gryllus longicercus]|uniref:Serine/threonine-protein phosphatase 6 regulatory subunit 3 n=1 Tax=Gryllus longicercus TaxID=2509291 RepID=A0AAN9VYR4_9ORTH
MFWKCNYLSSPHIEVLLNKEDVSLHEVMDEENVLEECRIQNKKLIDYLSRPDVMEELVTLTTVEPSGELDERARYKYSNIACELLTCDVPALNERLAGDEALLGKLYAFLEADCPLNPLLASFFSKTIGVLVARKSEQNWYSYQFTCLQVLEFLKSKENCISLLMKHLGTSAIMDLVLKLIIHVQGPEMKQNILNWLDSQQVVQCLVGLLDPSVDAQRHANASQLLCDVIKMSREKQLTTDRPEPDPILNTLESPETVSQLLEHILNTEKCETAIVGGISVLLALLDCNKPNGSSVGINKTFGVGDQAEETSGEKEQPSKIVLSTSHAILPYLKDLHNLLLDPPQKPSVKTTAGALDPPLGNTRLHIAKLLAALLATNSGEVNKELANLGTLEVLLDLFFKYTWNNFLHTQVEQCLYYALESELNNTSDETATHTLLKHIFVQCQLLEKVLKAWEENETQQSKPGGRRHGYMGHLIKIANHIVDHACKGPLADFIKEHVPEETASAWDAFVTNTLSEINKKHNIVLGGTPPVDSNTEDDTAYQEIAFQQPQMYRMFSADFQLPQMSPQFIDNYDIHDDEFGDGDENLHVDRMNNKTFDYSNEKVFKRVCAQKSNAFDGEDEAWNDHDDDDDTPTFDQEVQKDKQWPCKDDKEDESKGDDDNDNNDDDADNNDDDDSKSSSEKKEVEMEVDTMDPWTSPDVTSEGAAAPVAVDAVNPWACSSDPTTAPAPSGDDAGWADFGNAGFADFEANFSSQDVSENKETDNNVPPSALGDSENVTTNVPTTSEYNFSVVL